MSVDELRHAASKMRDLHDEVDHVSSPCSVHVDDQPDLTLALAEYVGCMNDCWAEHTEAIRALGTALSEVADLFEHREAEVKSDLSALGTVAGWDTP